MSPATDVCCLLANIARAGLVHCFLRLARSQCPHGWHYHSARAMLLLTVSTICSWSALIALCSWSTSIATYMRQWFKVYHIYNLRWVIVRWWRGSCVCWMTCHSFIIASCYNKCICFSSFSCPKHSITVIVSPPPVPAVCTTGSTHCWAVERWVGRFNSPFWLQLTCKVMVDNLPDHVDYVPETRMFVLWRDS